MYAQLLRIHGFDFAVDFCSCLVLVVDVGVPNNYFQTG